MTLLKVLTIAAAVAIGGPAVAQGISIDLSGNQEVPSISTAGTGTFDVAHVGSGVFDYTLTYQDLEGGAVLAAHIHFGQRSVIGGIAVLLCSPCPASPGMVDDSFDASDILAIPGQGLAANDLNALIAAGQAGLLYANVHTTSFPVGEIRGQLDNN